MASSTSDPHGRADAGSARPRRSRLLLAIVGMALSIILAVGLAMQEGGRVIRFDHRGHPYSPILRELLGRHRPAPDPSAPSGD